MLFASRGLLIMILSVVSTLDAAMAQSLPLQPIRVQDTQEFKYVRSYFPVDADAGDSASVNVMSESDRERARQQLQERMFDLLQTLKDEEDSIRSSLNHLKIGSAANWKIPANPTIRVIDSTTGVAAATKGEVVVISGRTIRGFIVGSLREWISGESGESWMIANLIGWPTEKSNSLSAVEAEERLRLLLEIIEAGGPLEANDEEQKKALEKFEKAINSENSVSTMDEFRIFADDVVSGRVKLSAADNWRMGGAFNMFTMQITQPAERFLLAHELGHLVLAHDPEADLSCVELSRVEADADAFAIALLSYNTLAGGIASLLYMGMSEFQSPEEFLAVDPDDPFILYQGAFGYRHALRYGLKESDMLSRGSACVGEESEARLNIVTQFWRELLTRRLHAVKQVADFGRQRPATSLFRSVPAPLDENEEQALLASGIEGCHGAKASILSFPSPLMDGTYQYFVTCSWPQPSVTDFTAETVLMAGKSWFGDWASTYAISQQVR